MPIYRTALCEDEKAVREELAAECRDIFAAWGVAATVDAFASADALASELAGGKEWDLYLLDIQMEGTDGLAFARRLYENGVRDRVLFITGSAEYALAGYSAHPLHYLLKPVRREELEGALRMALEKRRPSALLFRSGGRITALANRGSDVPRKPQPRRRRPPRRLGALICKPACRGGKTDAAGGLRPLPQELPRKPRLGFRGREDGAEAPRRGAPAREPGLLRALPERACEVSE